VTLNQRSVALFAKNLTTILRRGSKAAIRSRRAFSRCDPEGGASAVPARGLANRSRAASDAASPTLRSRREELARRRWSSASCCNAHKRSPKLSRGLKTSASAATERREASAPEARCGGNVATAWRAPRPEHRQAVTLVGVARLVMRMRLPALRPLLFFGAAFVQWRGQARVRTKNAPRRRCRLPTTSCAALRRYTKVYCPGPTTYPTNALA
jgi:hypothetical protein